MPDLSAHDLKWLDEILDRFESEWVADRVPAIEDYIRGVSGRHRQRLLYELVCCELDYCRRRGETISDEEFAEKHPDLADELPEVLREMHANNPTPGKPPNGEGSATRSYRTAFSNTDSFDARQDSAVVEPLRQIGEFYLINQLAQGGMGVVYKAWQAKLNRTVAVKFILPSRIRSAGDVQRFRFEAKAAARLSHPNILPIYTIGEFDGQHFFAMEYVEGQDLSQVAKHALPEPRQAAVWIQKIAQAVQYAHDHGIIHRDIKPSNVLIDANGEPRVSDFGLAKLADSELELTETGQPMGSPGFMPPEQAVGDHASVNHTSDIYAIGATLYHLLTGRPPFVARSFTDFVLQIREKEPVQPSQLTPGVPRDLETICLKCLAKSQQERYPSAQSLANDLQRFLKNEPIQARPVGRAERLARWCRRNPVVATLTAASASLLLLVAVVATHGYFQVSQALNQVNYQHGLAVQATTNEAAQRRAAERALMKAERQLYFNRISLAERKWVDGDIRGTERILDECPEGLRHWEWDYLKKLCHMDLASFSRHPGGIAVTRDGSLVAFNHGVSYGVVVVDSATCKVQQKLDHPHQVCSLAFSSDSARLATGDVNGEIRLWDIQSGEMLRQLAAHDSRIETVVFRPDGDRVASSRAGAELKIWDARTLDDIASLSCKTEGFIYSLDGSRLLAIRPRPADGYCYTEIDPEGGEELISWECHRGSPIAFAISDDQTLLATGTFSTSDKGIRIWDIASQKQVLHIPDVPVQGLAFSPDRRLIASANRDGCIVLYDSRTGYAVRTVRGHATIPQTIAFLGDSQHLVSGDSWHVKLWDLTTYGPCRQIGVSATGERVVPNFGEGIAFCPKEDWIATASQVWDLGTGEKRVEYSGGGDVAISPDGELVVTGGKQMEPSADGRSLRNVDFNAMIRKLDTAETVHTLQGHTNPVGSVDFNFDGTLVATGSADTTVKVWNAGTGRLRHTLQPRSGPVACVTFHPKSNILAVSTIGARVSVWDADNGELLSQWAAGAVRLSFSPDGKCLAAALDRFIGGHSSIAPFEDRNLQAKIWDAADGQVVATLRGHVGNLTDIAFSPDGRRIVTCGTDKKLRLWEGATGSEILSLESLGEEVSHVTFSPDGHRIVGQDWTCLQVWDTTQRSGSADSQRQVPQSQTTQPKPGLSETEVTEDKGEPVASSPASTSSFNTRERRRKQMGMRRTAEVPWEVRQDRQVMQLRSEGHRAAAVAFAPDGARGVIAYSRFLVLWDSKTGEKLDVIPTTACPTFSSAVHFSNDGRTIGRTTGVGKIALFDAASGEAGDSVGGHRGLVFDFAFHPDGCYLASVGQDGRLEVWDLDKRRRLLVKEDGSPQNVPDARPFSYQVAYSPDGQLIASSLGTRTIRLWDAMTGAEVAQLKGHYGKVNIVKFHPRQDQILSVGLDSTIRLWNHQSTNQIKISNLHPGPIAAAAAILPSGSKLLVGGTSCYITVFAAESLEQLSFLTRHAAPITSIAVSPDGKRFASSSMDGVVKVTRVPEDFSGETETKVP